MPPSEPTPADVAAVSAFVDGTPAPAPVQQPGEVVQPTAQPAPAQQPAQPVSQPTPSAQPQGDPFESLFAPLPTEVATPTQPVAPTSQPTEPVTTPQPSPPTGTPQPAPVAQPTAQPVAQPPVQTFDDYMKQAVGELTDAPLPDHSQIAPDDEAGIKNFFDELVNTAVARAEQKIAQKNAIQATERNLWDAAFEQYGSLRTNKKLRDMVHNIRMGEFRKGNAVTPTQAAEQLLDALKQQHQKGMADNQVITTIVDNQPTGGSSGAPVPTSLDREQVLTAVQSGGETALAQYLDKEVKAGRL